MSIENGWETPFTADDYEQAFPNVKKAISARLLFVLNEGKRTLPKDVDSGLFADVLEPHRTAVIEEYESSPSDINTKKLFHVAVLREALDAEEPEAWREPILRARENFGEHGKDLSAKDPYVAVGESVKRFNKSRGELAISQKITRIEKALGTSVGETLVELVQSGRIEKEHFLALRRLLNLREDGVSRLTPEDEHRFRASLYEISDRAAVFSRVEFTDRAMAMACRTLIALLPQSKEVKHRRRVDPDAICYWQAYIKKNYPTMLNPEHREATEAAMSSILGMLYPPSLDDK